MATLLWGEIGEAVVNSIDELDSMLDHLAREADEAKPFIVELVVDDGSTVSIGVGREMSVVTYVPGSLDPPYLQSVGEQAAQEELVFFYRGEWSEFPPASAVPINEARAALRRFLETEKVPDNIAWEET